MIIFVLPSYCLTNPTLDVCQVVGTVYDRPYSTELILIRSGEDERFPIQTIKIADGSFSFEMEAQDIEWYELVFSDEFENGAAKPISFLAEPGVLLMELYPMNFHRKNKLKGTPSNEELDRYNQVVDEKFPFWKLEDSIRATEILIDSLRKSTEADSPDNERFLLNRIAYLDTLEQAYEEMYSYYLTHMYEEVQSRNDLIGLLKLSNLFNLLNGKHRSGINIDFSKLKSLFDKQYIVLSNNYLYKNMETSLIADEEIAKGEMFIDFEAVDFAGREHLLSQFINGKITIVHFWGSWCLPCRKKGIELITLYNDFREKGLSVVGVARERSLRDAIVAANSDGYPWSNLVELNDKHRIWRKYKMQNSGGDIFVFDEEGKIITYSISVDNLRDLLTNYFENI
ncbi:TlpA disulfide reductase family protein [Sphingobacterium populi]|uniref:TlpA disulfide reductase family protein n=1 Tax=Sphingobacterium sp. CFCC 11742 TaxID=1775560 RepID=UPI0018D2A5FB|nr:TlpA disulfide reductase family protein [Sphingobacterium sp. CFCC 11742]